MPTDRPEPRRLTALLAALVLLVGGLGACSVDVPFVGGDETVATAPDGVATALQRLLDDRARAVRRDDQRSFERTLAGGDREALVVEERLFHNFTSLPLERFRYRVDPDSVRRDGDVVVARVWRSLQLDGFDRVPVRTADRMRFVRSAGSPRGWLVSSATDEQWRRGQEIPVQPWDLARIEVAQGDGVLLVADAASAAAARDLLPAIESGISDVATRVPYPWDRSVVVYAPSDPGFLDRLGDLPGGDPAKLDGVTFPVRAEGAGGPLASTRFVLHPRMLTRPGRDRDRLLRHELVHVALGLRDDQVPTWLAEGIAEWVSAADLAEQDRTIASTAVAAAGKDREEAAARSGAGMPGDRTFNGPRAGANYGLAWFACDHVADTYGEDAVWRLFDAMREARGEATGGRLSAAEAEAVLQQELGITGAQLAEASAGRILATFG